MDLQPNLAPWIAGQNYIEGAILAAAGLFGAIFTAFTLVGGTVPWTAGKARLDGDREQLDQLQERLAGALKPGLSEAYVSELRKAVNELRDDYNSERNRQWVTAAVLYAVIGSVVAALLARDWLQAIVFGAGWTGVIGTFGLKSDYAERKAEKDDALVALEEEVEQMSGTHRPVRESRRAARKRKPRRVPAPRRTPPLPAPASEEAARVEELESLLSDAEVARSL